MEIELRVEENWTKYIVNIFFRCNPPCVHGQCIKHAFNESLDKCECDLGWTGPVCSLNCGCHNHSTCHTGTGVCDNCQGNETLKYISANSFISKLLQNRTSIAQDTISGKTFPNN